MTKGSGGLYPARCDVLTPLSRQAVTKAGGPRSLAPSDLGRGQGTLLRLCGSPAQPHVQFHLISQETPQGSLSTVPPAGLTYL